MSGGAARGRRRAHPDAAGSGPHDQVAALLAAALRETDAADAGELRAVAAFRTARDEGALRATRTRRRDDWRPQATRRLRTTLSVAVAGLALGGAAYIAIGSATDGDDDAVRPEATATATATASETRCRAHENARGTDRTLDPTAAWQRPVTAAGGEKNAPAHCAATEAGAKRATDEPADRPADK